MLLMCLFFACWSHLHHPNEAFSSFGTECLGTFIKSRLSGLSNWSIFVYTADGVMTVEASL